MNSSSNSDVRIAVIAGVGSGLGASLARRFVQEGCKVALMARSTEYLEQLAHEINDKHGSVRRSRYPVIWPMQKKLQVPSNRYGKNWVLPICS